MAPHTCLEPLESSLVLSILYKESNVNSETSYSIIGSIPPALMATLGPKLGLRTMVIPRYSFGWYPAKLIAVLGLLNQIGWGMVNAIAGAQFLYDVGNGKLPMSIAVLVIGLLAMIIGMFGYKHVHRFERYSWMVVTFCFIIVAGFGAKHSK
jgi:purine-cytosine permease-like protein